MDAGQGIEALLHGVADVRALRAAAEAARAAGEAVVGRLVDDGVVGEDIIAEAVARAVGSVVVDLESGEIDDECVGMLPERIARRYLLVAVAPAAGGTRLRVAFADPLDTTAVDEVRSRTGLEVEPLVATVSDLRAAIRRAYARDTRVMNRPRAPAAAPSELASEATQRLAGAAARIADVGTAPTHRLADGATLEQRHEALLLALVDAGLLSRADYTAALRRLLGRPTD